MTFDDAVRGFAMLPAENLNKSNFFSGISRCKPRNVTLGCKQRFRVAVNDKLGIEPG
jgi:hypothetical protein